MTSYDLTFDTFPQHLQLLFREAFKEKKYTDVTLVSDDQTQFKAHKIVLSGCSPVFMNIIESNPNDNPLIYLKGIHSSELEAILEFMYLGEAKFYQERMGEFIQVAKDLELKEISEGLDITDFESEVTLKNEDPADGKETKSMRCKPKTKCPECDAVFAVKKNMLIHYRGKHQGIRYPCSQCDHRAVSWKALREHVLARHEKIRYPCDQCDHQATKPNNLRVHIQSMHEGVRFPCNFCGYQAKQRPQLRAHIEAKHKGIKSIVYP